LNIIIALAPYVLQLLAMVPGFEKTLVQLKSDIGGHPNLTAEQKISMLKQAGADVDAADVEVQAAVAKDVAPTP
jgi:hypothetical protein